MLVRYSGYLERIKRSVDKFLFYAAVTNDSGIYSCATELTRYRVHKSVSSIYTISDFKAFCLKQGENTSKYFEDFSVIHDMCQQFGAYKLEPEVRTVRAWFKFNSDLFRFKSRRILTQDFIVNLKLGLSDRLYDRWMMIILLLSLASLILPDLPRHFIFNYYNNS